MKLAGEINIESPQIECENVFDSAGIEFILNFKKDKKQKLDPNFDIWIKMSEDRKIKLSTDFGDEDQPEITDDISIEFESGNQGSLVLTLNIMQVNALKEIFKHYIDCYYSAQILREIKEIELVV